MIRRRYFGWHKDGVFFLSHLPPDAPVRRAARYESSDEIKSLLTRRGVEILWYPPLPEAIHAEINKSLRVEGWEDDFPVTDATRGERRA